MNVVFRTDASATIGRGHVTRCLTLANALHNADAAVSFVCREHAGHACDLLEREGIPVSRLPAPKAGLAAVAAPAHASGLDAHWREDAEQTLALIEAGPATPDWLVVDHYALEQRWESAVRPSVKRIIVIDDLADRVHDCDLLLDQNLLPQMPTRYVGKVPAGCVTMLGPQYALLQPSYAELRDRVPPRSGQIRRVLICFGGADSENLTGRALRGILSLGRPDLELQVVISAGSPFAREIRRTAAGHKNVYVHSDLPSLARLMAQGDLAIGAAGATSWERLCLGLPSLVVVMADNQWPIARELSGRGLIRLLGHRDEVSESTFATAVAGLIEQQLDPAWSLACAAIVDGHGVGRVRAALTVTATTALRTRRARLADEELLLGWANDPTTRASGFHPEPISAETHRSWYHSRLRDLDACCFYVVATTDGVPVGQVRFQRLGSAWQVHYALGPVFRGRGLGRALLRCGLKALRAEEGGALIFGEIRQTNRASQTVFESLGFSARAATRGDSIVYQQVF
jgi:UDP-2,4-diacetamido-2,4,6-trideoxy-beta-L-altropyranose hydrolase